MGYLADCLLNTIEENICCIICLGIFEKPVQGPCGHVFCQACIMKWILPDKLTCPMCRALVLESHLVSVCRPIINLVNKQWVKCSTANCDLICEIGQLTENKHRRKDGLIVCNSAGDENTRSTRHPLGYPAPIPPLRRPMVVPVNGGGAALQRDGNLQPMSARLPRAPISLSRWRF